MKGLTSNVLQPEGDARPANCRPVSQICGRAERPAQINIRISVSYVKWASSFDPGSKDYCCCLNGWLV